MAGPAVAGLIGNLLYVNDDLTYDEIYDIVTSDTYSSSLSSCPNDSDEGNCNGIEMSCDEIIDAAGGSGSSDSDDDDVPDGYYKCNDGCLISESYVNDGYYCDCSDCGDESALDCGRCPCPNSCGEWDYCSAASQNLAFKQLDVSTANSEQEEEEEEESDVTEYFTCDDGCNVIDMKWVNDGSWCDCQDCSDEKEWTCGSCATGCPDKCDKFKFTYCWSELNLKVSNLNSHTNNSYNTGSGTHCGCPGNDEEYDTLTIANLSPALHGASEVYDFNGDWILVNGCINSVSYFTRSIYNNIFFEYETFVLYFNGGSWVIGKESNIDAYWAGCPQIDLFDCNGYFWSHGNNGYDSDSSVSTQINYQCTTSNVDETSSSLSVSLNVDNDNDGGSSNSSSSNNDDIQGWVWLLIGAAIVVAIISIVGIYICSCTNYKFVNNKTQNQNQNQNGAYTLMQD